MGRPVVNLVSDDVMTIAGQILGIDGAMVESHARDLTKMYSNAELLMCYS